MKYYDVYLKVCVLGYEKWVVNRTQASDEWDAITKGIQMEVHNLEEEEVAALVEEGIGEGEKIEDGEMLVSYHAVVELIEVPVVIDGIEVTALLPHPKDPIADKYFTK